MNTAQKIILVLTTTTAVYLLLTTQLHLYNKLTSLILKTYQQFYLNKYRST